MLNRVKCSVVKCFLLVQWFWFNPAVLCSAVYLSAVYCSTVKCSAATALCGGVVLICPLIYSHNLFINLISMRHHQRESSNQGFTVCVIIMCGSHEICSKAVMQTSAGVSLAAGKESLL